MLVVSRQVVPSVSIAVTLDQKLRVQIIPDNLNVSPKCTSKCGVRTKVERG